MTLAAYTAFLMWLVLFKLSLHILDAFSYPVQGLNLEPFADVNEATWHDTGWNLAFFVPLGLLLAVSVRRTRLLPLVAAGALFSMLLEAFQYVFAIGITDVTDVIANTSGVLVGLLLYLGLRPLVSTPRLNAAVTVATGLLFIGGFTCILSTKIAFERDMHRLSTCDQRVCRVDPADPERPAAPLKVFISDQ